MAPKSEELVRLGRAVRALRREAGISQEALAHAAGLHRNYVGGVERGERNISFTVLLKLARGMERRPAELVERFQSAGDGDGDICGA
jgi:transcriptional regulator with XRE-family HTH domain